jgi:Domain of unknown function (DUF4328)
VSVAGDAKRLLMPTTCPCPSCGRQLSVPDEYREREVRCPSCSTAFVPTVPAGGEAVPRGRPGQEPQPDDRLQADLPPEERYRGQPEERRRHPAPWDGRPEPAYEDRGPLPGATKAVVAMALLGCTALVDLISLAPSYAQYQLLERAVQTNRIDPAEAQANDAVMALMGLLQFGVMVPTVIAFCVWIYQAHKNLPRLGASGLRYSPGWAVGWFFVPIFNLWRPYQVAQEIWKASDPRAPAGDAWHSGSGSWVIVGWWAFWIISNIVGNLAAHMLWSERAAPLTLQSGTALEMLSSVLAVPAALLAILMIKRITDRQQRKYEQQAAAYAAHEV